MSPMIRNQAKLAGAALAAAVALTASGKEALAQSGHFLENTVACADIGTQLSCTGSVAGLGGTTFTITVTAPGTASVECINPGGNRAPGQDTEIDAAGTSGPFPTPRNGRSEFTVTTAAPTVTGAEACPNASWTAMVVDVDFGDATLTLFEDSNVSDTFTVPAP
jgi:hypothetical protein